MIIDEKLYRELRCPNCRRLICYEYVRSGRIAFHCPRCGELNTIDFKEVPFKKNIDTMKVDTEGGEIKNG